MNLQNEKIFLCYFTLSVVLSGFFMPKMAIYAEAEQVGSSVSGSAVVTLETAKSTPTPKKKSKKKVSWKVYKKKVSHPKKTIHCGVGFDVKGSLISERKISNIKGMIRNEKNKIIYKKSVNVNKKKADLNKIDEALKFSELKKGKYVYEVDVTDTKKNTQTVIEDEFSIKQPKWMVPVLNARWGDGWHCGCSFHHGKHYGWDIRGGGNDIHSVADGTVVYAQYHKANSLASFGNLIVVYHGGGIYSYYAHCSKIKVKVGKKVNVGDVLGITGSTGMASGPHLHFELRKGPDFHGGYNSSKLVDKYTYRQFNPGKKIKR